MLPKITENMTLKEIMEMDDKLYQAIQKYGFDTCCTKMSTLKDSCENKGLDLNKVLEELNEVVEEINYIEQLINESEES
ncbi:hypothetical protein JYK00_07790 [Thermosipho ferrireducens]|uniref:DUF1858 domain-containing protein n=1 Tax=Thermosipho ferrireducens TaxID=2571116 RepID=A0ABX7S548_9BACT|nr:hypothetical protein [Thermosipho ferrireducens]QTA37624.1 hypothetical protein JYK00_07790 [Thermosipho ferrireducens]